MVGERAHEKGHPARDQDVGYQTKQGEAESVPLLYARGRQEVSV